MKSIQKIILDFVCDYESNKEKNDKVLSELKDIPSIWQSIIKIRAISSFIYDIFTPIEQVNENNISEEIFHSLLGINFEKTGNNIMKFDEKIAENYGLFPLNFMNFIYLIINATPDEQRIVLHMFYMYENETLEDFITEERMKKSQLFGAIVTQFMIISWETPNYDINYEEEKKFISWIKIMHDILTIYFDKMCLPELPIFELYMISLQMISFHNILHKIITNNSVSYNRRTYNFGINLKYATKNQTFNGYQRFFIESYKASDEKKSELNEKYSKKTQDELANDTFGYMNDIVFSVFLTEYFTRLISKEYSKGLEPGWPLAGSSFNGVKFYEHPQYCNMTTSDTIKLELILNTMTSYKEQFEFIRHYYISNFNTITRYQLMDWSKTMNISRLYPWQLKEIATYYNIEIPNKDTDEEKYNSKILNILIDKLTITQISESVNYYIPRKIMSK